MLGKVKFQFFMKSIGISVIVMLTGYEDKKPVSRKKNVCIFPSLQTLVMEFQWLFLLLVLLLSQMPMGMGALPHLIEI